MEYIASPSVTTPRRIVALTLSAAALALPLAATAAPAHAAEPKCVVNGFTPKTVVLGLSPKAVTVKPSVSGCELEAWAVEGDSFVTFDDHQKWVFEAFDNRETAAQDVVVHAVNPDYAETVKVFEDAFRLKRNTIWDKVDATPEPVRKGAKVTVKARLRVADWTNDEYDGYTSRTVDLQTRTPNGSYTTLKSVKTGSGGNVSTTVTATADACYRFLYGGNSIAGGSTSTGDCIDVR